MRARSLVDASDLLVDVRRARRHELAHRLDVDRRLGGLVRVGAVDRGERGLGLGERRRLGAVVAVGEAARERVEDLERAREPDVDVRDVGEPRRELVDLDLAAVPRGRLGPVALFAARAFSSRASRGARVARGLSLALLK